MPDVDALHSFVALMSVTKDTLMSDGRDSHVAHQQMRWLCERLAWRRLSACFVRLFPFTTTTLDVVFSCRGSCSSGQARMRYFLVRLFKLVRVF